MNEMMLLEAIGEIDDGYVENVRLRLDSSDATASETLRKLPDKPSFGRSVPLRSHSPKASRTGFGRMRRISHRASFVAAAVLLLLMSLFTMAMAFNEDFRSAVFRFLRISSPDVVLSPEEEQDSAGPIAIIGETFTEDAVSVQYIRINGIYTCGSGGEIYLYDEETRENTAAYTVENGELRRLTSHEASLEYTWNGITYSIGFVWYEDDELIYVSARGHDPENTAEWSVQAVSGSDCLAAVILSQGSQLDYQSYPLLYDLRRKELLDPAAQCGALKSRAMTWIDFSRDASKLLIDCDYFDSDLYCLDAASRTLHSLDELSGMHVLGAWFLDSETVCCISEDEEGKNTCRTVTFHGGGSPAGNKAAEPSSEGRPSARESSGDASAGITCSEIFSSLPNLENGADRGIRFTGGRYALLAEESSEVYVMDLKTGEKAPIEGFTYPSEDVFTTCSSAGDKILYVRQDGDSTGSGLAVNEMGILNLEERRFTVFAREGYETRYEGAVSWFDNDRIVIEASSEEGSYLYLFTIK